GARGPRGTPEGGDDVSRRQIEIIELVATDPDAAIACDLGIASPTARAGIAEGLAGELRTVRAVDRGVEVTFAREAYDDVRRYVDLESRCCAFLTLVLQRHPDAVVLRVTGRPDAVPWIRQLFSDGGQTPV
ncbi:MAG TPA: hypothetical protein VNM91_03230, partial [Dehalococcoidia bacterium]|nr:hypothetical protein [Dehalococcoidia bacterium]